MSSKDPAIRAILSQKEEICQAKDHHLTQNYKAILKGANMVQVKEVEAAVLEYRDFLKNYVQEEALECLPSFKMNELKGVFNVLYEYINNLHNLVPNTAQTYAQQAKPFIKFWNFDNSEGYIKYREFAWRIIMDSLSLLNSKRSHEAGDNLLQLIQKNVTESEILRTKQEEQSKQFEDEINRLSKTHREEIAKLGISKHAEIFDNQAQKHKRNALIWGIVSTLLIAGNIKLIVSLYDEVKKSPENVTVEFGILGLLLVSLVSFCIVMALRNFFAEKHNQTINQHKANCLGSYHTFVDTASEGTKDMILQYTTQTIFSQFNPGYLSKDGVQSPSPIIELLKTVENKTSK